MAAEEGEGAVAKFMGRDEGFGVKKCYHIGVPVHTFLNNLFEYFFFLILFLYVYFLKKIGFWFENSNLCFY